MNNKNGVCGWIKRKQQGKPIKSQVKKLNRVNSFMRRPTYAVTLHAEGYIDMTKIRFILFVRISLS